MGLALDCKIDKALLEDKSDLASLEAQCFREGIAFSKKQIAYLLKSPRTDIYVMRLNGTLAAYAIILKRKTCRGEVARLYSFAVKAEFRGQGLGKKLMLECLDKLGRENIQAVFLEVEAENNSAIALYESVGFSRVARLKSYYGENQDGLKMKLTLT
ncbi:GNAT family N-acetyltransferase [Kamptonema formosum]|uniref:GNAT family N-acetyltransferase n=1 Tax=Kamptonema formosum TaxID=331992 RepID=UPI00034B96CE|nr:GNAT family N-acetyltransferase [Oscillatoria sp. PCC 10802]